MSFPTGSSPSPDKGKALRLFLSYSHKDASEARTFAEYLRVLLFQELASCLDARLYYDEHRFKAGDDWKEAMTRELRDVDVLIFLVSTPALRQDRTCMREEIPAAARRGALIIPIIVKGSNWQGVPIPDDPQGRTFGALNALPLDEFRTVVPVKHWKHRDKAWAQVIDHIRDVLIARAGTCGDARHALAGASSRAGSAGRETGLLPYLCDQAEATSSFDLKVSDWGKRALAVLVKGVPDDNVSRFWDRLRLEHLSKSVRRDETKGRVLGEDLPLVLPAADPKVSASALKRASVQQLSQALTKDPYALEHPAQLTGRLAAMSGTVSLFAMPDVTTRRGIARLRRQLEALLAVIDEIDQQVRQRIVLAIILEQPDKLPRELTETWKLGRFSGTFVLELDPLETIGVGDARLWYKEREINDLLRIDEHCVMRIFRDRERHSERGLLARWADLALTFLRLRRSPHGPVRLRLGTFDEQLQTLLRTGGR